MPIRVLVALLLWAAPAAAQAPPEPLTLADYRDFDQGWEVRGDRKRIPEIYTVRTEGDERILSAHVVGEPIRIFKKVAWNPFTHPIVRWKWRVQRWPDDPEASIDFYVSLDRDVLGIPTITKYLWSPGQPVGKKLKGGFFSPNQVVIRSGTARPGEWVSEELDVLKSFRELYGDDPSRAAVGVGLLVSSGVQMEISGIVALPPSPD